jgi:hypothetical protein
MAVMVPEKLLAGEKMDPKAKALFIEALRSGRYPQTSHILCRRSVGTGQVIGFCCLGVLGEVAKLAGVKVKIRESGPIKTYDGSSTSPPSVVREWAGLTKMGPGSATNRLMEMNDLEKKSFDLIADWVEVNL